MKFSLFCLSFLLSNTALGAVVADGAYVVDPDHAHVGFSVSHLGISNVQGQFRKFSGNMKFASGVVHKLNLRFKAQVLIQIKKEEIRILKVKTSLMWSLSQQLAFNQHRRNTLLQEI